MDIFSRNVFRIDFIIYLWNINYSSIIYINIFIIWIVFIFMRFLFEYSAKVMKNHKKSKDMARKWPFIREKEQSSQLFILLCHPVDDNILDDGTLNQVAVKGILGIRDIDFLESEIFQSILFRQSHIEEVFAVHADVACCDVVALR